MYVYVHVTGIYVSRHNGHMVVSIIYIHNIKQVGRETSNIIYEETKMFVLYAFVKKKVT